MGVTQELARLYREYYANRLSLADYRHQRGLLLDSLIAAEAAPEFEPVEDITVSRAEQQAAETAREPAPEPRKETRGTRWPAFVAVVVVLFGGTFYAVTTQLDEPDAAGTAPAEDDAPPTLTEPVAEPSGTQEVYIEPDVGQRLVEAFLDAGDWSVESLQRFRDAWVSLPAQDRIVAKGAMWFAPLADRLEYEISEAEEFSDDPEADAQLQQLYATAVGLGLTELAPDNWQPGLATHSAPREETVVEQPANPRPAEPESMSPEPAEEQAVVVDPEPAIGEAVADASEGEPDSPAEAPAAEEPDASRAAPLENDNACSAEQLQTRRRGCFDLLVSGGQGPSMRVISAGEVADVNVDAPFAISATEVSRADFDAFCAQTGADCLADPWPGENMPVVNVSRNDAAAYCDWLSEETGYRYRLPTSAEWEYAARAGATTDYPFGDEITPGQARYSSITSYDKPLPREDRTTPLNDYGLWHVIGNVREWVGDSADGAEGVVRGGSYADDANGLRLSSSHTLPADHRDTMTGFRVLREL